MSNYKFNIGDTVKILDTRWKTVSPMVQMIGKTFQINQKRQVEGDVIDGGLLKFYTTENQYEINGWWFEEKNLELCEAPVEKITQNEIMDILENL